MPAEQLLVHNVYFALNERSPSATEKLIASCKKYLTDHAGVVFFAVGTLAESLNRPVNVRDFDVALHIVFANQNAHDAYQVAKRHQDFIAENKPSWKSVRVFDSLADR